MGAVGREFESLHSDHFQRVLKQNIGMASDLASDHRFGKIAYPEHPFTTAYKKARLVLLFAIPENDAAAFLHVHLALQQCLLDASRKRGNI